MRLVSIASGSSGNCIYIGSESTHLLVDVGISNKKTEAGLNQIGLTGRDIDGILITHEHSDHIQGLGVISRKYGIPIYATPGTIEALKSIKTLGAVDESLYHEINADGIFTIKDMEINPMKISHDAAQPVAYRFRNGDRNAAVATDMGMFDDYTVSCLQGMDTILLEANHDVNMLQVGPYPYQLKRRILGDRGHLSNELSGQLLKRIAHEKLQGVVLGHLSKDNNIPELAYETVRVELAMGSEVYNEVQFPITVAKRDEVSTVIKIA